MTAGNPAMRSWIVAGLLLALCHAVNTDDSGDGMTGSKAMPPVAGASKVERLTTSGAVYIEQASSSEVHKLIESGWPGWKDYKLRCKKQHKKKMQDTLSKLNGDLRVRCTCRHCFMSATALERARKLEGMISVTANGANGVPLVSGETVSSFDRNSHTNGTDGPQCTSGSERSAIHEVVISLGHGYAQETIRAWSQQMAEGLLLERQLTLERMTHHQVRVRICSRHSTQFLNRVAGFNDVVSISETKWNNKQSIQAAPSKARLAGRYLDDLVASQIMVLGLRGLYAMERFGEGQIITVSDSGLDYDNCLFKDPSSDITPCPSAACVLDNLKPNHRKVVGYQVLPNAIAGDGIHGRGTEMCGCISGSAMVEGQEAPVLNIGLAPASKLFVQDLSNDVDPITYDYPLPLGTSLLQISSNVGARIHVIAWERSNGDQQVNITEVDSFIFKHPDYLVIVAAAGDTLNSNPLGLAKNVLTVGAHQFADAVASQQDALFVHFSSSDFHLVVQMQATTCLSLPTSLAASQIAGRVLVLDDEVFCPDETAPNISASIIVLAYSDHCAPTLEFWRSALTFLQAARPDVVLIDSNIGNPPCALVSELMPSSLVLAAIDLSHDEVDVLEHSSGTSASLPFSASFDRQLVSWSAAGPVGAGQIKPEIFAPGTTILAGESDADLTSSQCGKDVVVEDQGGHLSAALVAAAASLVREHVIDENFAGSASLLKAVLLHAAQDFQQDALAVSACPPNCRQGHGAVNLLSMFRAQGGPSLVLLEDVRIQRGDVAVYCFLSRGANEPFAVTLVWTDPPSLDGSLVSDLDLVVRNGGEEMCGNGVKWRGAEGTTFAAHDDVNNNEKVMCETRRRGWY
eukprot:748726-Hanusia_phi.AAC.2